MSSLIQPVVAMHPRQKEAVDRLVAHCLKLDGTKVKVIEVSDEGNVIQFPANEFAGKAAYSLRSAALAMKGQHFIWLEPDSIPIKQGWVKTLSHEYWNQGKMFLISSDCHPPHDLVGGIGVYPPETTWLVPKDFEKDGWDMFLIKNLSHLVGRTPLIQHSYGFYLGENVDRYHSFPRDDWMLRPETIIFHSDKQGDLTRHSPVPHQNCPVFSHAGDLGDVIASLPAIRHHGGGRLIITQGACREPMRGARFDAIAPLIRNQKYVREIEYDDSPKGVTHDIGSFRNMPPQSGMNLTEWQSAHLGIKNIDQSPWLFVEPDARAAGRVCIARSIRYNNHQFPWRRLLDKYNRRNCFFVGLQNEHDRFKGQFGQIERIPTSNLLELARLIAGSRLMIANQSCPFWIGAGLGVPLIQETYWQEKNSIVPRDNARYFQSMNDIRHILS